MLDADGVHSSGYTGQAWVHAFDSSARSRLGDFPYVQMGAPVFRGRVPVIDGRFSALFRVPKDITYGGTNGRVSSYVWGGGRPAAFGAAEGLVLSGTATELEPDDEGPEITLGFVGHEGFRSGDFVPPRTVLRAGIRDEGGINVTGETGHDIALRVDGTLHRLTELFTCAEGDYRQGTLDYPLPALAPGAHTLSLKAWDTFNNSGEVEVVIRVAEEDELVLAEVLFYPNPLDGESGHFTYTLSGSVASVRIEVYSLAGALIDQLEGGTERGYNQVAWTPPTALANGSYLYRVEARSPDRPTAEQRSVIQVMK